MLTRRSFILSTIALSALAQKAVAAPSAPPEYATPVVLTLSDIDADADVERLKAIAGAFVDRSLHLTMAVSPFDRSGKALANESPLARWLLDAAMASDGRLELALHAESLEQDDYFDLRKVSDAQAAFCKGINRFEYYRTSSLVMAQTLVTRTAMTGPQDGNMLRAAGIRSVVRLTGDGKASADHPENGAYWFTNSGMVNVVSPRSPRLRPTISWEGPARLQRSFDAHVKAKTPVLVLEINYRHLADAAVADLANFASQLAGVVADRIAAGTVRTVTCDQLYRQSRTESARYVVVRVDDYRVTRSTDAHRAFTERLVAKGIPFTEAVIPAPTGGILLDDDKPAQQYLTSSLANPNRDVATHGWNHSRSELLGLSREQNFDLIRRGQVALRDTIGAAPISYVPPNNEFDAATAEALGSLGLRVLGAAKGDMSRLTGLDTNGLLRASNTIGFESDWTEAFPYYSADEVMQLIGSQNDAILMIHPGTADTADKRATIDAVLDRLAAEPGTRLVTMSQYRDAVLPRIGTLARIQEARSTVNVTDWKPASSLLREHELQQDAAKAWSYFEWGARTFGGLVPSTAWEENGSLRGYEFATMWDLGSNLLALISAERLGIIDTNNFEESAVRLLKFIDAEKFEFQQARLPLLERSLSSSETSHRGFDTADTGRLLIALRALDKHTGGAFGIRPMVESWGLEATLVDSKCHDVSQRGRLKPKHDTSYANYFAAGYRLWGFDVSPVFDWPSPDTNMDQAVRTYRAMAQRGRIASEPHLTEEMELGGTPHGRLAIDLLLNAQIEHHARTGSFVCRSEIPIPGEPYFTYQGYQLNDDGGEFVVDAPKASAIAALNRRGDVRYLSTKAAYLLYVLRPGTYSRGLMGHMRPRLSTGLPGLPSGVHEISGEAMPLTDINTNAVVLEAIAHALGGGPAVSSDENGTGEIR